VVNKRVIFILAGGLGNQLFQIAAALQLFQLDDICFDSSVAKARLNVSGNPEISAFTLPARIHFTKKHKGSWIVSKSTGYVARMNFMPRSYEKIFFMRYILKFVANLICAIYFRSFRRTCSPKDLGFTDFEIPSGKVVISGFFQSYKWVEMPQIRRQMQSLKIRNEGPALRKYKSLAIVEKPIVVHIRLGDYKSLKNFGVLNYGYYEQAIPLVMTKVQANSIWVFSDEICDAKKKFNFNGLGLPIRWMEEIDDSAASTLELMRHGVGYVIANSTFSWWAAYLSYCPAPPVAAPTPWFAEIQEPRDLIPSAWTRIRAF
jgi:hypothetical protein